MGWNRSVVAALLAATLATAAPTRSYARGGSIGSGIGREISNGYAQDVEIGLGITTGVVALVGGAIWYYWHHRHASDAMVSGSAPPKADEPNAN